MHDLPNMDLDALATFLAVHRAGGISHAAATLFRSQPAISRRIALLEHELKAPLFDRIGGSLVLSEAGRTLLPFAERAVAAIVDAGEAMRAFRDARVGSVSIAVVGTLADAELTDVLRRFQAEAPGVEVELRTGNSAEVSALVRRGIAALGLRYLEDSSPDLDCRRVGSETLVVACAASHRYAGRKLASIAALRKERWLAFPRTPGRTDDIGSIIEAAFIRRRIPDIPLTPSTA